MSPSRTNKLIALGSEAALAIALCLVSYGLFSHLLGVIFPSTAGLHDLTSAAATGPDIEGSGLTPEFEESPARLTVVNPNVTHKRGDGVAWTTAKSGTELHGRDGVQTAARGTATIDFGDQNLLHLGENTLIIVRESTREPERAAHQASVLMMEGRLWADVEPSADGAMELKVETPSGSAHVGATNGKAAQVRVAVGNERAATFSVIAGEARIETKRGTLRVAADHYVQVDSAGAASEVQTLPPAPVLSGPAGDARVGASGATFTWAASEAGTGYHFVLARDEQFRDIAVDVMTREASQTCERLQPGDYYWRVSTLIGHAEGAPSAARMVQVKKGEGPRLAVGMPPAVVRSDRYRLTGTTEPQAQVWIADQPVDVSPTGRFDHEVKLKPGVNVVVVEAVDDDGNSTYRSAIVNAKP